MSGAANLPTLAIIGGTGREGKGLAYRWARAGYRVVIGSRSLEKAVVAAAELTSKLGTDARVSGASNVEAAERVNIVVLTVPYSAHRETIESVKSALGAKLLIDATVPLVQGRLSRATMPLAGSAAQEAKQILGEGAEVAAAFHNISHELLFSEDPVDCEVLVTGTSKEAREQTLRLVEAADLTGWDAGPLDNSAVSEGLASVLIHINKKYGSVHSGIRITGVKRL